MDKSIYDLFDLTGKTAVVTGGASLLGRKITEALLDAGAHVWITTSRKDPSAIKADTVFQSDRLEILPYQMQDSTGKEQLEAIRDHILAKAGRIDIFVSNSVIRTDSSASDQEIKGQIAANTMGLIDALDVFGEQMCAQGKGSLIIMSSNTASQAPDPGVYEGTNIPGYLPGYNVSKAACSSLMRFAASKYGKYGVRCNAISPIAVHSDSTDKRFEENYSRRTLLGRICYPDDIKGLIVFLASDASAYLTGLDIPLDGGHSAL